MLHDASRVVFFFFFEIFYSFLFLFISFDLFIFMATQTCVIFIIDLMLT